MMLMDEKTYLVDFLLSFELMDDVSEWDDGEKTLLDKVVDDDYRKLIESYTTEISSKKIFQKFVTKEYNLLSKFLFRQDEIGDFSSYIATLSQLDISEFKILIAETLGLPNESFEFRDLDQANLSAQSKWELFLVIDDFEDVLPRLIEELEKQYRYYCDIIEVIEASYGQKIQDLRNLINEEKALYDTIFEDILTQELFDEHQEFLILYLSIHRVMINYKNNHKLLAIGLYVYDYYLEKKKQQAVDYEVMQNVLKVLADQTRYGIIKCIGRGITSNKEIAKLFSISPPGVTYQLKYLAENDIIYKDNLTKHYVINKELIRFSLANVLIDLDIE